MEEIEYFGVYGQPNVGEVNSENLHDILQPHVPIYDEDFGQPCEDICADFFSHVLSFLRRICCSIFSNVKRVFM
jgi:hypothetical protein